jgi:hypothetical protein
MNTITITLDVGFLGIEVKSSPLADALRKILQQRLQEQVTPEFVAYCLYLAAKKRPTIPKRPKKAATSIPATNTKPEEGPSDEK